MKVYITKYALSQGIFEVDGEVSELFPDTFDARGYLGYFHGDGKEWHRTRESAIKRAEEMRKKKIASLKKQIEKLEKMKFE